jgi:hypothetical protein
VNERTRAHFEAIGIEGVLSEIAEGTFGAGPSLAKSEAEAWVAAERAKRDGSALSRKEAREEETLSIARKALSNAQRATIIAIFAVIVSIAMAAQKLVEWLSR